MARTMNLDLDAVIYRAKGWVEIGTVTWKRVDTNPQHLQE